MNVSLKQASVCVLDVEGCSRTGVIEYGVAILNAGQIVETHTRLCCARSPIDPVETRLHGIRQGDVAGLDPMEADWQRFAAWQAKDAWAAHHASVESALLHQAWPFAPGGQAWGPWLDTHALYRALFPSLASHKLGELIERFRLSESLDCLARLHCPPKRRRFHCALYDALASAILLSHLTSFDGFENVTLEWLIEVSQHQTPHSQAELF